MAKPVILIKVDERISGVGGRRLNIDDLMKMFEPKFPDYHVLAFPAQTKDAFEVQVFHEKDFTEIQYNELKELITHSLK